ncbi:MAG: hydrogenase maturation nickel metallochaperone HypA [Desulfobaccales bacterium]
MHEYALMQGIVAAIQEQLAAENVTAPVLEVGLTIGMLDIHSEAAARQAFEVLTQGTPLEQATLTLTILPATLTCPACNHREPFLVDHFHSHDPVPLVDCPRCGQAAHLTGGRGVGAIEVVLAGEEET